MFTLFKRSSHLHSILIGSLSLVAWAGTTQGYDLLTLPGKHSHDGNGQRIAQAQPPEPAIAPYASDFTRSGFRHTRSTLQYDQGADNFHVVERWGPPVQPYGEWRFPNRPFSAPYENWGPPFAGMNNFNYPVPYAGGFPGFGGFNPGGFVPGIGVVPGAGNAGNLIFPPVPGYPYQPYPTDPNGPYPVPPWYDGYYPSYPHKPRLDDRQFYFKPNQ